MPLDSLTWLQYLWTWDIPTSALTAAISATIPRLLNRPHRPELGPHLCQWALADYDRVTSSTPFCYIRQTERISCNESHSYEASITVFCDLLLLPYSVVLEGSRYVWTSSSCSALWQEEPRHLGLCDAMQWYQSWYLLYFFHHCHQRYIKITDVQQNLIITFTQVPNKLDSDSFSSWHKLIFIL